jgi:hypothetical protein
LAEAKLTFLMIFFRSKSREVLIFMIFFLRKPFIFMIYFYFQQFFIEIVIKLMLAKPLVHDYARE